MGLRIGSMPDFQRIVMPLPQVASDELGRLPEERSLLCAASFSAYDAASFRYAEISATLPSRTRKMKHKGLLP